MTIRTRTGSPRTVRMIERSLKAALAGFLRDAGELVFAPADQRLTGLAMGDYNCRCITGTDRLSGHAFGRAVDIFGWWVGGADGASGETYLDYERLVAAADWEPLFRVGSCLHLNFGQVLHWPYSGHRNHFHAEIKRRAPVAFWRFQDGLLNLLLGSSLAARGWRRKGATFVPGGDVVGTRTAALRAAIGRIPALTKYSLWLQFGRRFGRPPGDGAGDLARLLLLGTARHGLGLAPGGRATPVVKPPPPPAGSGPSGSLVRRLQEALAAGRWHAALGLAVLMGNRDVSKLTNLVFFARHPELEGRKLVKGQPRFKELSREWLEIRDSVVLPYLRKLPPQPATPPSVPGPTRVAVEAVRPQETNALEAGMKSDTTLPFRPLSDSRKDLVLAATAASEGGYDAVNVYDRGILSWGIMQWTAHAGSLQKALAFIKRRLTETAREALWNRLFPGLDVTRVRGVHELVYRGDPVPRDPPRHAALRRLFRGAAERGRYDDATIRRWVELFALAGRHPVIRQLQREHAHQRIDHALRRNLGSLYKSKDYRRVRDYLGGDLAATALFFSTWTQNPRHSYRHVKRAVDRLAERYGTYDLGRWPADWRKVMAAVYERVLRASRFAYWGDAKAKAKGRKSRTQMALDALRRLIGR